MTVQILKISSITMLQSYLTLTSKAELLISLTLSLQQTKHFTIHIKYIKTHSYIFSQSMEDDSHLDDTTILVNATLNTDASPSSLTKRLVNKLGFLSQQRSGTETANIVNNNFCVYCIYKVTVCIHTYITLFSLM